MDDQKIKELVAKIEQFKKDNKFDLSAEEDLSIAIMNLVSLEEHFFFSGAKTGKPEYYDLLNDVREIRKSLLAKMMDQNEAESWCISKHLLAATMRMIEVGTKYQKDGQKDEAEKIFKQAYRIYSNFWALRLKIVDSAGLKKVNDSQLNIHDQSEGGKPWSVEDIVTKLVDCCHE